MKGFTLIEVLIYTAILTVILTGVLATFYSIINTSDSLRNQIELVENSKFLEQKLRWALTGATQINTPGLGSTSDTLSIERPGAGSPLVFDLSNGIVRMASGSGDPVPITNDFVIVSSLSFKNFSFSSDTKNSIRIKANLTNTNMPVPSTTSIDLFISIQ